MGLRRIKILLRGHSTKRVISNNNLVAVKAIIIIKRHVYTRIVPTEGDVALNMLVKSGSVAFFNQALLLFKVI